MKDLIIIGAGPGGYELALKAAHENLTVLLIEKKRLGGVCLQEGCIPTKTLYKTAQIMHEAPKYNNFGINISEIKLDYKKVFARKEEIKNTLEQGIAFSLEKAGVETVFGAAKLVNNNTVSVNGIDYSGKNIIIATGSSPISIPSFSSAWNSGDLLSVDTLPRNLVIIGGGVIGIEMAGIMHALGVKVSVVEYMERIIPPADKELSKRLHAFMRRDGIDFYLNAKALAYENGEVIIESKGNMTKLLTDAVLVSVGRRANVEDLGLADVGIEYSNKGIIVDDNYQTNIPHIYAIGDVNAKLMLAHVATYQGYHVLNHILKKENKIRFDLSPNCVFSFPELAWVGKTEEELPPGTFETYKGLYRANGKAHAIGETDGFVKILVKDGLIVGVHMIGSSATSLLQELSSLMNLNITKDAFVNIIHAHPTLNEIFTSAFN